MASTEHIEAKLCAYVDGELDAQGRAEIEQHLATNAQHRALLEELMRQREVVRALPRERAPEDLYENFSAQLERSVLLDEPDDSEIHIAGRINRWPQMYAAAAVILLVVGLAAVIYMVLPGGSGSHTPPQFVIGPTTTGPVKLAEIPEDTDAGVARKDEAKAETVDTFSLAATTPGAKTSADNLAKAQGDIFKQKSDTTVAPAKTGALAGVPAALAPKQQVHDLFDSDLKTHVQTITNGEVKDPVFVVVSTQNPVVAQSEVTQFLGQNKIVWQPIAQPMPAPVELSANDVLEGARGQQQTQRRLKAQTREADNIVTGSGNGSGPYRAASSASPAPATPATVTPTAMPALGPATREAIVQDSSTVWNVAPSAGATLLGDNRYGGQQRASQQLILARNLSRDQLADLSNRFGGTQSQVISTYYDTPGQAAVDSLTRSRAFRAATTAGSDRFVRTVKEQARQAFDYATTLPATTQAARVLESGDRVEIAYGEDRVHLTRVNEKGEVVIPSVGPVTAWGKTPPELAKDITDAYQKAGQPRPTTVNVRAQPALSSPTTNKTYALRSGDTVTVHYGYENPDLRYTREALVDANGLITLPMLGELEAKGKTPQELAAQVARAAARFEPGRATFTCAVRNTAGEMITGSAPSAGATTRNVDGALATTQTSLGVELPDFVVQPATRPALARDARCDVVIVLQTEGLSQAATTMPAAQTLELAPAATERAP